MPRPPRRHDQRQHGFTLLELVVVAGVLAVLTGIGIGYLRRSDSGRGVLLSTLAGQLRSAALTARTRSLPTEVRIDRGQAGRPASVRSRELLPVAVYHLEPKEPSRPQLLQPVTSGDDVPQGRFGHGRRNADGNQAPLLRLPLAPADFDLGDGFVLRLDLLLERRQAAAVLRIGSTFELALDERGRPRARLVPLGDTGQGGAAVLLAAEAALPLGRWCTLEVAHDGSELWLAVDGVEVGRTAADLPLHQQQQDELLLSPGDAPVPGVCDELQWLLFGWSEPQLLPRDYEPAQDQRVRFDGHGELVGAPVLVFRDLRADADEQFPVKRGGVIQ